MTTTDELKDTFSRLTDCCMTTPPGPRTLISLDGTRFRVSGRNEMFAAARPGFLR